MKRVIGKETIFYNNTLVPSVLKYGASYKRRITFITCVQNGQMMEMFMRTLVRINPHMMHISLS